MSFVAPPGTSPFCIDRYEASLRDIEGNEPVSPYAPLKGRRVRAVARSGEVPQGYISEIEASAACKASGKRLCAENEWVAACRGGRKTRFPYGEARKRGYCNDDGKSPLVRLHGSLGVGAFRDDPMNDPRLNQLPDTLARAGEFERCTNEYGVFDMVGNLHEWVDDPAGTFRGGYYLDTRRNGDGCDYRTTAHDVAYEDYSTGFRCCADKK
jgi:formylglycine-generating enzyme required for sulfatase activity